MSVPNALITTVNSADYTSREYADAVERWPSGESIWERLRTRAAKEHFVRYIVREHDTTDRRTYRSFTGLCTGFAAQLYLRYNDSGARVSRRTERQFSRLGVRRRRGGEEIPAKLQIPIYVALVPGHAFNAVLIEGSTGAAHARLDNFLFVFPQSDIVCQSSHANVTHYLRVGILTICRAGLSRGGGYRFDYVVDFIKTGAGNVFAHHLSVQQRICYNLVAPVIFRADDAAAYARVVTSRRLTFEAYVRNALAGRRPDAASVGFVFRLLAGRTFRRRPGGTLERLTVAILRRLTGW